MVSKSDRCVARLIARELHDSLGQDLTAAKITLDMLAQESELVSANLREAQKLVDRCISDTRTLSHLLHPPLLDEAGFVSAARWYVGTASGKREILGSDWPAFASD